MHSRTVIRHALVARLGQPQPGTGAGVRLGRESRTHPLSTAGKAHTMFDVILRALSQPSTYAGLSGMAGAVGLSAPEFQALATVASALFGAVAVFVNERGA